jgi:Holliday junction DNA helicase RuvA
VYEYLEGKIELHAPTRIVLDVGGVGYDVSIPLGAEFRPAPGPGGDTVRVWTHLLVREDAHRLFGFPDVTLREVFRMLLVVRGVGPALALAILSGLPGDALVEAILNDDVKALTRIKGVGKKTAAQILLDLRDRAPRLFGDRGELRPAATGGTSVLEDAVQALVSIGYTERDARKNVDKVAGQVTPLELEPLIRAALSD